MAPGVTAALAEVPPCTVGAGGGEAVLAVGVAETAAVGGATGAGGVGPPARGVRINSIGVDAVLSTSIMLLPVPFSSRARIVAGAAGP
jgi:hypothetical protein